MSNTKHTPWFVYTDATSVQIRCTDSSGKPKIIARMSSRLTLEPGDEELSDAFVMAASHELLQALEALLFVAKAELADPEDCGCIHAAEAAISKARGEA